MRYALLGLPLGAIGARFAWDGNVSRLEGVALVGLYALYVGTIWVADRKPPALGETGALEEARNPSSSGLRDRVGRDVAFVLLGVVAMAVGATLLVEAIQRISGVEAQTRLGLTLVGFATGFECIVLAWSAARRGMTEAVVAGVVGSYAYNASMTLGAGALVRPLALTDAELLHLPLILMLGSMSLVVALAARRRTLARFEAVALIASYGAFLALVLCV